MNTVIDLLDMCKRRIEQKQHPEPRFTAGFRILWLVLSKLGYVGRPRRS